MTVSKLPALFISHGAPLFAVDAGETGPALTRWGSELRSLNPVRGIVIMSPHWMARAPAVMTNPAPATWHDFGGFPEALYALQYPASGSPALARQVLDLLAASGLPATEDAERPLDHGAWVPLMHLFPQADIPVVQVALPARASPAAVLAMGRALRSLREQGVLVIGSGSMTHNLSEFFGGERQPEAYVGEFSRWVEAALQRGDREALLAYRSLAPHAARAHPSEDHFLPLFFALGAADEGAMPAYLSREVMHGILAMDAFALGEPVPVAVAHPAREAPVLDLPLDHLLRRADANAAEPWLLVLLHGVGSHERDLFGLADDAPDNVHVLSLRAPNAVGPGAYAWFQFRVTPTGRVINTVQESASRAQLALTLSKAAQQLGVPASRVVVGGFSQGGIMALSLLLTQPGLMHAAMVMHSRLLDEVRVDWAPPAALVGKQLWVSHGTADTVMPLASAHATRAAMQPLPLTLHYAEFPNRHEITADEWGEAMRWLGDLAA